MGPRDMSMLCSIKRTMLGPCLGHSRAMFWLFLQYLCFQIPQMAQIFTGESGKPNRRKPFNVGLLGPYKGHVCTISGPCLGHIRAMFLLFLQYLCFYMPEMAHIFSGESCKPNKINQTIQNYWTIKGPCFGHIGDMFWLFLQYLCFYMTEMAQIFTRKSCRPNRRIPTNVKLLLPGV